jgi:hypothetical protein
MMTRDISTKLLIPVQIFIESPSDTFVVRRASVVAFTTIVAFTILRPEYAGTIVAFFGVLGTFVTAISMVLLYKVLRSAAGEDMDRDLRSLLSDAEYSHSRSAKQMAKLADFEEMGKIYEACSSCLKARFIWGTALPMALLILIPICLNPRTITLVGRRLEISLMEDVLFCLCQMLVIMFQMIGLTKIVSLMLNNSGYHHRLKGRRKGGPLVSFLTPLTREHHDQCPCPFKNKEV